MYEEYDREWKTGDREKAKQIAIAAIEDSPGDFTEFEGKDIGDMVAIVGAARANGREDDRRRADMWLLAKFPPQRIGGSFRIGA